MIFTDDTGAKLDAGWANELLQARGLKLMIVGERPFDVDCELSPLAALPEMEYRVQLIRPGSPPRVLAELECSAGARVRAAKQLLVALDVGLLP